MRFLLSSLPTAAAPPCATQVHTSLFSTLLQRLLRFVSIPLSLSLSRLVDMCTYFYVWKCCKGMEFHVCSRHILQRLVIIIITHPVLLMLKRANGPMLILPHCAASLLWWDGLFFWRESREQWMVELLEHQQHRREFPPYLRIYFHALWRDAKEVPWRRNPSCYKKEVRIYFDNTIVVCKAESQGEKRRGNDEELLGFFLELIYPMFCRVLHYCISDWIEGMKVLLHTQSLDQALA